VAGLNWLEGLTRTHHAGAPHRGARGDGGRPRRARLSGPGPAL